MKKIIFTIALVLTLGMTANAQRDGFFSSYDNGAGNREGEGGMSTPLIGMPGTDIGTASNADAPLGTGLLIMTALGAGYAISKRRARQ